MSVLQPGLGTRGHLVADPRRNLPEMIGAAGRSAGANRGLPVPPNPATAGERKTAAQMMFARHPQLGRLIELPHRPVGKPFITGKFRQQPGFIRRSVIHRHRPQRRNLLAVAPGRFDGSELRTRAQREEPFF